MKTKFYFYKKNIKLKKHMIKKTELSFRNFVFLWLTNLFVIYCSIVSCLEAKQIPDKYSAGVVLGEPTGLTAKIQITKTKVIDLATSFDTQIQYYYFSTDYLIQNYNMIPKGDFTGTLPAFWGYGIRVENNNNSRKDNSTEIGLRFIIGAEYIFQEIPFNIFVKIVPTVNLAPATSVFLAPSLGIRYIFK